MHPTRTGTPACVIGGGVHGMSVAFHLAKWGVRTRVFKRGAPASGPTGRSSAICRAYYTNEFLARAASESLDMFAHFAEVTGAATPASGRRARCSSIPRRTARRCWRRSSA